MTDHQDLDVFEFEPKLLDAVADEGNRTVQVRIDENVALRRDDQVRRQVLAAHVVKVVGDAKGRNGRGPIRVLLSLQHRREQDQQCQERPLTKARLSLPDCCCNHPAYSCKKGRQGHRAKMSQARATLTYVKTFNLIRVAVPAAYMLLLTCAGLPSANATTYTLAKPDDTVVGEDQTAKTVDEDTLS